jgi:hypothetical protein
MIDRKLGIVFTLLLALTTLAGAQSWAPLSNQPPVPIQTTLLLTDGTVMAQETSNGLGTGNWWKLTPDNTGSYQNGTWSQRGSMPSGYAPRDYASAVLPDGRVVVVGGEYNGQTRTPLDTSMGAIYNPATDTWTSIIPPQGVSAIGDASSVILPNGTFMMAPCCGPLNNSWLLDPSSLTWSSTGSNKADSNNEEGWTLLPNGNVLTVDTRSGTNSEVYNPATGSWSWAGSTIVALPDATAEIGPAVLRPDGTVFATGATSNTAIYNTFTGGWSMGPTVPNGWSIDDGPAALLPNGNVLIDTGFGQNTDGTHYFEFNGSSLLSVPDPPSAATDRPYFGRMLVLPTGKIMYTNLVSNQVMLYSTSGSYQPQWQPTITSVPFSIGIGTANNSIFGTQFNGLSQGAMYGDDAQSATNYPLVRITNNATGHVFYARTHDHSTMAVATGSAIVSTLFDIPLTVETGDSTLQVVANGIPSNPVPVSLFVPRRRACCTF